MTKWLNLSAYIVHSISATTGVFSDDASLASASGGDALDDALASGGDALDDALDDDLDDNFDDDLDDNFDDDFDDDLVRDDELVSVDVVRDDDDVFENASDDDFDDASDDASGDALDNASSDASDDALVSEDDALDDASFAFFDVVRRFAPTPTGTSTNTGISVMRPPSSLPPLGCCFCFFRDKERIAGPSMITEGPPMAVPRPVEPYEGRLLCDRRSPTNGIIARGIATNAAAMPCMMYITQ